MGVKNDYRKLTDEQVQQWCRVKHDYWTHDNTRLCRAKAAVQDALCALVLDVRDLWAARKMYKRSLREFREIEREFRKRKGLK